MQSALLVAIEEINIKTELLNICFFVLKQNNGTSTIEEHSPARDGSAASSEQCS